MSRDLIDIGEKVAVGGYHLFVGNTLSTLILAVNSVIIARLLGPANYGIYSISLVVPALFVGLVDFGVSSALTQFSAKLRAEGKAQESSTVIGTGLFFELIVGTAASASCFLLSGVLAKYVINRPELSSYLSVVSTLILLQTISTMLTSIFIGFDRMDANALMMVVGSLTKAALSALLVIIGFGVAGALTGHLLYYVAFITAGFTFMRRHQIMHLHLKIDSKTLKAILKYSLPIYFSGLLGLILNQYQTIILVFFATNFEIGNFQVVTLFSTALGIITFPFNSFFPGFTKSRSNMEDLKRLFKQSVKYTAILVIPATLAISVMSRDLVFAFYGPDYNLAPLFLSIFILTNLYAGLGSTVMVYLFSSIEKTGTILKSNLISLLIFLPLAPALTYIYSVLGLISAIIAAASVSITYYILAVRKLSIVPELKSSIRIYVASILAIIPLMIYHSFSPFSSVINLLFSATIFSSAYLTLLPLTKAINNDDIEIFTTILNKNRNLSIFKPIILFEAKIINR